ncbi:MAG: hypothetical protein EPN92_00140 [Chitinophagaceae bacterium]|nr:MAG: hypothetical protein EPN92_00140 [Chitinophagaceae bacterium]
MDQKIRTAGWRVTGIAVIFCGLLSFLLSIWVILSKPAEIWWLGLILLPCSIVLLYSGVKTLYSAKKEKQLSDEEQKRILDQVQKPVNGVTSSTIEATDKIILARWMYSVDEWKQFINGERKERKTSVIIEIILITVLAGFLLHYNRDVSWPLSFSISLFVALLIGWLRYRFTLKSVSFSGKKMPEVIITPDAVLVNGHFNRFYGNNLWLGKVDVKDTGKMNVLEITYCWLTRTGETSEEIRIPIPKGKIREAIEVQEKLMAEKK